MGKIALNTQEAFEKALRENAETYGFTLHIDYRFGNVGFYRIVPPTSFKAIQMIDFTWDTDPNRGIEVRGILDPPFPEAVTNRFYFKADELDQFLKALRLRFAKARSELNRDR